MAATSARFKLWMAGPAETAREIEPATGWERATPSDALRLLSAALDVSLTEAGRERLATVRLGLERHSSPLRVVFELDITSTVPLNCTLQRFDQDEHSMFVLAGSRTLGGWTTTISAAGRSVAGVLASFEQLIDERVTVTSGLMGAVLRAFDEDSLVLLVDPSEGHCLPLGRRSDGPINRPHSEPMSQAAAAEFVARTYHELGIHLTRVLLGVLGWTRPRPEANSGD
jgi:hypothetical protein